MTHFGLQSSPSISEIKHAKIFFIIPLTYSKTASGFPLQSGIQVYFSSSIFLPSLTTKHHSTEQIPTVMCTSLLFELLLVYSLHLECLLIAKPSRLMSKLKSLIKYTFSFFLGGGGAVLGPLSSNSELGLLLIAVCGLLIVVASRVVKHGL